MEFLRDTGHVLTNLSLAFLMPIFLVRRCPGVYFGAWCMIVSLRTLHFNGCFKRKKTWGPISPPEKKKKSHWLE